MVQILVNQENRIPMYFFLLFYRIHFHFDFQEKYIIFKIKKKKKKKKKT